MENKKQELNKILEVCPLCRFPHRISGHLFTTSPSIMKFRCSICKHFPDYVVVNANKKEARIIYRNFNNSKEYFKKIIKFLEIKGFKVLNKEVRNSSHA